MTKQRIYSASTRHAFRLEGVEGEDGVIRYTSVEEQIAYDVLIDPEHIRTLARCAASNKSGRAVRGAMEIRVTARERISK